MYKIFSILTLILLVSACGANKKLSNDSRNLSEQVSDNYAIIEENVDAFTLIKGDEESGVRAADRVFFEFDSSNLSSRATKTLDKQILWLKQRPNISINVEGHCDERGTREYNLALGERRANAVKNYMVNNGINSSRITLISYGKERPAVIGDSSMAHAENRRAVTVPESF